jgi:hypothetical protein
MSALKPRHALAGFLLASGLLVLASWPLANSLAISATRTSATSDFETVAFQQDMRRLWEDHITWTRLYIVSVVADLPDQSLTAQRLLRNQADIGAAIAPFYGDKAGDRLTTLLEEHILGAADLLAAAKAGDQNAVEEASERWYANADEIAAFLNEANPEHWPLATMQMEMRMHLDLTFEEAVARLQADYDADIAAYDAIHAHILPFADALSAGIVHQFPERFS